MHLCSFFLFFFFFNDTATTEIYTLSLHDALPILAEVDDDDGLFLRDARAIYLDPHERSAPARRGRGRTVRGDRKSTRLNSSHSQISYAVFCLKKKKKKNNKR